jgi:hypothetical protein
LHIYKSGLKKIPEKIEAIDAISRPTEEKEVIPVMSFLSYYARFIPRDASNV